MRSDTSTTTSASPEKGGPKDDGMVEDPAYYNNCYWQVPGASDEDLDALLAEYN